MGRGSCTATNASAQKRCFGTRDLHYEPCKRIKEKPWGVDAAPRSFLSIKKPAIGRGYYFTMISIFNYPFLLMLHHLFFAVYSYRSFHLYLASFILYSLFLLFIISLDFLSLLLFVSYDALRDIRQKLPIDQGSYFQRQDVALLFSPMLLHYICLQFFAMLDGTLLIFLPFLK